MFGKKKELGIVEILYRNLKLLRSINKARKEKEMVYSIAHTSNNFTYQDARIASVFALYQQRYPERRLERLIGYLLKDMERLNFEKTSSIPQKFEPQYTKYQSRYDKLKTINLLSHTVRVFLISLEINKNVPDRFAEQVSLLALVHDFGKSQKVFDFVGESNNEKHNHTSAKYLNAVMDSMNEYSNDFIASMCDAIYFHHSANADMKPEDVIENEFIRMLNQCDRTAREQELRAINRQKLPQNMLEIEDKESR
ncbi:HD domain-containing protein [Helicobacter sp. MIT 00-7814]|nr:HD domain-containing protein [Helicobacter sp. MIT 00-7814]